MKRTDLATEFLDSFAGGPPRSANLSTVIDPDLDPSLDWMDRRGQQADLRNESQLKALTRQGIRLLDIIFASLALLALLPVCLIASLAIRIESPGPVLYTQMRTGLNRRLDDRRNGGKVGVLQERRRSDRRQQQAYGRPFAIYKFRSMVFDAEKSGIQMTREGDARITRVGAFIRRFRIDEIPQFWNVIKGDMSIVGPRPERPEIVNYLEEQIPGYVERFGVKPGITGLAQIRNGYDTDLEHIRRKVALDRYYIRKCSFWNDLRIMLRTIPVVIRGDGAM